MSDVEVPDGMSQGEFVTMLKSRGYNPKYAAEWWRQQASIQVEIDSMEVKDPLCGPWPRNRTPKFDVSDGECGKINTRRYRGESVERIASSLMLPERVVKEHLRDECEH